MVCSMGSIPAPLMRPLLPSWCLPFSWWTRLYLPSGCPADCTLPPLPCRLPFPGSCDCQLHAGLGQLEVFEGGGKVVGGRSIPFSFSTLWAASPAVVVSSPWTQLLPDRPAMFSASARSLGHRALETSHFPEVPAALGADVASCCL